jgi:hypothetical protein
MWKITGLDYDAALYANAEARHIAGVDPVLWAKWIQRQKFGPSRKVQGGRAGQYAAKRIFEMRLMNVLVQQTAIPVSEAQQIAELAAKGSWNIEELAASLCSSERPATRERVPNFLEDPRLLGIRNARTKQFQR